jgi:hypothetical protein
VCGVLIGKRKERDHTKEEAYVRGYHEVISQNNRTEGLIRIRKCSRLCEDCDERSDSIKSIQYPDYLRNCQLLNKEPCPSSCWSVGQSVGRSVYRSVSQTVSKSVSWSVGQFVGRSVAQLVDQSVHQSQNSYHHQDVDIRCC